MKLIKHLKILSLSIYAYMLFMLSFSVLGVFLLGGTYLDVLTFKGPFEIEFIEYNLKTFLLFLSPSFVVFVVLEFYFKKKQVIFPKFLRLITLFFIISLFILFVFPREKQHLLY